MRLGVGIGEASCAPVASSLIGDLVPAERRARAMALFMVGLPVGLALSFLVSSTIAQRYSWEMAFFVAGAPGLILAVMALFIADPRAGTEGRSSVASPGQHTTFVSAARLILSLPTMWLIIVSGALHNFNMYALGSFLASLLKRYHEVSIERAGQLTALVYGCGALGLYAAGWLGDRAFRYSVSGRLHVA